MKNRSITSVSAGTGQKVADVLELAHPRDRVADSPRLEIGDRQRQQMAEQPCAELDVDAVGGVGEQVGAQDPEDDLEERHCREPDHQHVQRAQAAVHQDLVDHHLEEQRRHQREYLQKERGNQDFGEEPAVFVDRADEPGDVELAREVQRLARRVSSTRRPSHTASNSARVMRDGFGDAGD